jgi:hypothetical protein
MDTCMSIRARPCAELARGPKTPGKSDAAMTDRAVMTVMNWPGAPPALARMNAAWQMTTETASEVNPARTCERGMKKVVWFQSRTGL